MELIEVSSKSHSIKFGELSPGDIFKDLITNTILIKILPVISKGYTVNAITLEVNNYYDKNYYLRFSDGIDVIPFRNSELYLIP